jgi:ABC-type transport system involved in Fe-S cluster assembly fused permease/ATPase subunit
MVTHLSPFAQALCAILTGLFLIFVLDRVFVREWRRRIKRLQHRADSRLAANKLLRSNPRASSATSFARGWL